MPSIGQPFTATFADSKCVSCRQRRKADGPGASPATFADPLLQREAARPEDYHVRTPSAARLREVFRLETERWVSNDWVVQYRGHFLQLKPQNRRYGPTQSKAMICGWEDGAVEVRYRNERIEYEDLVLRPSVVTAPKARPRREPAQHGRSKPTPNHPWREGYEERRKQLLLDRTQMSALIGSSASASP
jgi:hypothetical protein